MNRALCLVLFLVPVGGCQLPPERAALKPLPEDSGPLPFADLTSRARSQAAAATEAFYDNKWADLEEAARGLEQTARFLGKATEVPAERKESLPAAAEELGKNAATLREAAKDHEVKQANETLQRLNLKVRELRMRN